MADRTKPLSVAMIAAPVAWTNLRRVMPLSLGDVPACFIVAVSCVGSPSLLGPAGRVMHNAGATSSCRRCGDSALGGVRVSRPGPDAGRATDDSPARGCGPRNDGRRPLGGGCGARNEGRRGVRVAPAYPLFFYPGSTVLRGTVAFGDIEAGKSGDS